MGRRVFLGCLIHYQTLHPICKLTHGLFGDFGLHVAIYKSSFGIIQNPQVHVPAGQPPRRSQDTVRVNSLQWILASAFFAQAAALSPRSDPKQPAMDRLAKLRMCLDPNRRRVA